MPRTILPHNCSYCQEPFVVPEGRQTVPAYMLVRVNAKYERRRYGGDVLKGTRRHTGKELAFCDGCYDELVNNFIKAFHDAIKDLHGGT